MHAAKYDAFVVVTVFTCQGAKIRWSEKCIGGSEHSLSKIQPSCGGDRNSTPAAHTPPTSNPQHILRSIHTEPSRWPPSSLSRASALTRSSRISSSTTSRKPARARARERVAGDGIRMSVWASGPLRTLLREHTLVCILLEITEKA